jgi:hypothetical protein
MDALIFDMDGVVGSVGYWSDIRKLITEELGINDVDTSDLVGLNAVDEYASLAERNDVELSKESYVPLLGEHAEELYGERISLFDDYDQGLTKAIAHETTAQIELLNGKRSRRISARRLDELYDQYEIQTPLEGVIDAYYAQYIDELEVRPVLSGDEPMSVEAITEERGPDRDHVVEQFERVETYGYVEQRDAGVADTGKRDGFDG